METLKTACEVLHGFPASFCYAAISEPVFIRKQWARINMSDSRFAVSKDITCYLSSPRSPSFQSRNSQQICAAMRRPPDVCIAELSQLLFPQSELTFLRVQCSQEHLNLHAICNNFLQALTISEDICFKMLKDHLEEASVHQDSRPAIVRHSPLA